MTEGKKGVQNNNKDYTARSRFGQAAQSMILYTVPVFPFRRAEQREEPEEKDVREEEAEPQL